MEKTAPDGLVLNTEIHEVELTYAGQEVSVTEADTAFYNGRQKVTIDLTKTLEQDEIFGIGNAGEIQNAAFGLYAAENLTAADGSVIPADGLIEIVFCSTEGTALMVTTSDKDGAFAFEDVPFGRWIVREIASPEGYEIDESEYAFEIKEDGQIIRWRKTESGIGL